MFGSVYMSRPLSHFVPAYPSPSSYPQVHSLVGLHLYSRLAPRFFWPFSFFLFFRFHIYVLAYGICFSLSDLTSLCMTDSRSIHLTTNNSSFVPFYGRVIFHCIYVPHLLYPFISGGCLNIQSTMSLGCLSAVLRLKTTFPRFPCNQRVWMWCRFWESGDVSEAWKM